MPAQTKTRKPRSIVRAFSACFRGPKPVMENFDACLENNRRYAANKLKESPSYFSRFSDGQAPEYLWIGCSDSRIVVHDILGKGPGDVFMHRNVGNVVSHGDINCMSVLEYGIGSLKCQHVVVCGHYACGACKAALTLPDDHTGYVNGWISYIRNVRDKYKKKLVSVPDAKKADVLAQFNALEQLIHVGFSQPVQAAWARGQEVHLHCVVYNIHNGTLKVLAKDIDSQEELEELVNSEEKLHLSVGV